MFTSYFNIMIRNTRFSSLFKNNNVDVIHEPNVIFLFALAIKKAVGFQLVV